MLRQTFSVCALAASAFALCGCAAGEVFSEPSFSPVQTNLFAGPGGQAVAWADYDLDGDLDLAIGFQGGPVRLFRQTEGKFAEDLNTPESISKPSDYRSLSWGDANRDGRPDLYVGFGRDAGRRNLLLIGTPAGFDEAGEAWGVDALGTARQSSWIDFDRDGDSDLFVAMRDRSSKLFRNDGETFTDVSSSSGLNDPRRSVAAVWFDYDRDSDLDLYLPNQSGDRDGLYRNDDGVFTDVAQSLNIDRSRRPLREGSVGATLCDVNNDGHFDIFVPVYGADMLYIADGQGGFSDQATAWGVDDTHLAVSADCGDFDNDGRMDLYLVAYQRGVAHGVDRLYHNRGDHFVDVFPKELLNYDADHGVRFADFDEDGDLDLAMTNRNQAGRFSLWRNELTTSSSSNFLKIDVRDANGHFTRQGDEVHVYDNNTGALIAAHIVDTGGGYVSQNIQPVHIGLGSHEVVTLEVTSLSSTGRKIIRRENVASNQTIQVKVSQN